MRAKIKAFFFSPLPLRYLSLSSVPRLILPQACLLKDVQEKEEKKKKKIKLFCSPRKFLDKFAFLKRRFLFFGEARGRIFFKCDGEDVCVSVCECVCGRN